ncbi:hypothetical protein BJX70DRAFT_303726 [Aspergillus crustosus]
MAVGQYILCLITTAELRCWEILGNLDSELSLHYNSKTTNQPVKYLSSSEINLKPAWSPAYSLVPETRPAFDSHA